jgi:hypothetical protein
VLLNISCCTAQGAKASTDTVGVTAIFTNDGLPIYIGKLVVPFILPWSLIFGDISMNEMPLSSFKLTLNKIMPLILPLLDEAAFKLSQTVSLEKSQLE